MLILKKEWLMDNLTKEQRRKTMQRIRSKGTTAERIVERELRRRKIYFAKQVASIIGKPDIVFRRKKVIVFIDSDFWHVNPKRFIAPKTNVKYWQKKIARNKERDKKINLELKKSSWQVLRLWEYDVKHNTDKCIDRILDAIASY